MLSGLCLMLFNEKWRIRLKMMMMTRRRERKRETRWRKFMTFYFRNSFFWDVNLVSLPLLSSDYILCCFNKNKIKINLKGLQALEEGTKMSVNFSFQSRKPTNHPIHHPHFLPFHVFFNINFCYQRTCVYL